MKQFKFISLRKSNSYILLCILLLFSFTSTTLYASELPPIESPSAEAPATEEPYNVTPADGIYYVTSSGGLNVRQGPSIQYDIIGNLPYGEKITITGTVNNNWFEISYEDTNGYIFSKYVSTEAPTTLPAETEEVPETPETALDEIPIEQGTLPFISDTTMVLLLSAIIFMIVIIISTIISFFLNNHKYG